MNKSEQTIQAIRKTHRQTESSVKCEQTHKHSPDVFNYLSTYHKITQIFL